MVGTVIGLNRVEHGLTFEQLAREAGVTWEFMVEAEHGREFLSLDCLERIAMCFGKTADNLLSEVTKIDERQELRVRLRAIAESEDNTPLRELLEFIRQLPPDKGL